MARDIIDFCIGWGPWPDEPFLEHIREHCRLRRLRIVVCKDDNVWSTIKALESGRRHAAFFLDADADYDDTTDPYARLGFAARDGGGFVVNEPDHARRAANKAIIHYHFERSGIPVPYTVVVRNWEPADFRLSAAERRRLGRPFIVKPSRGFGKQGVARVEGGTVREIAVARKYDRGDDFLVQEFVEPEWLGPRRGWFRLYIVLGQVIPCWWDNVTEHYAAVTPDEFEEHALAPLCATARRIASAAHMNYFSTEVAVVGSGARRRFLAIDYVNDNCDMTPQSFSHCGVPDRVVRHIAERLAEAAWRARRGLDPVEPPSIWFAG